MENNQHIICECGKHHNINTKVIVVKENCFSVLISELKKSKFDKILFFYLNLEDDVKNILIKELESVGKNFIFYKLSKNHTKTSDVESFQDMGQDLVVAIGNETVISIAKYYAYMFANEVYIFPIGEFLDFSFSKFSRLKSGMFYDFYLVSEPSKIFVDISLNKYNELQTIYIMSKFIAYFDLVVREFVFKQSVCNKLKEYISKCLNKYINQKADNQHSINIKNIWLLIRLGQAMSYFSETKNFFGGDKAIVDLLQAKHKAIEFLESETIAFKLVFNSYSYFYKTYPTKSVCDINLKIKRLENFLNISTISVFERLVKSELIIGDNVIFANFNNYFHYLKNLFKNCQSKIFFLKNRIQIKYYVVEKYGITPKQIESCFALSSNLYDTPCSMHLMSIFGYLDKLL